jgi:D-sedoheptulose 7-phosphate isomerase
VVIGISGSGNSKNVLLAIEYANQQEAISIGITGFDGGKLRTIARHSFNAGVNDMQLSEDLHMMWVHIMMKYFY